MSPHRIQMQGAELLYIPRPIDTRSIMIDGDLESLVERLAEHVHDVWASQRFEEGWVHGPARDDQKKTHPCLVAYDQLPENEKEYDRITARGTIKALAVMGADIHWPGAAQQSTEPLAQDIPADGEADDPIWHTQEMPGNLAGLRDVWEQRPDDASHSTALQYCQLAQAALGFGATLFAYDIATTGLQGFGGHIRLGQLRSLALIRSGAPGPARDIAQQLLDQGQEDSETFGLLASAHKALAMRSGSVNSKAPDLRASIHFYGRGFELASQRDDKAGAYYNGINAATLSLLAKDAKGSGQMAQRVLDICRDIEATAHHDSKDLWLQATIAEAILLLGRIDEAEAQYRDVAKLGAHRPSDLASTRRQAKLILKALGHDQELLNQWMGSLGVGVYVGFHGRDDHFDSEFQLKKTIQEQVGHWLDDHSIGSCYGVPNTTVDLMFLEALISRGCQLHLVVPYPTEQLKQSKPSDARGDQWRQSFDRLCEKACEVLVVNEAIPDEHAIAQSYAWHFTLGSAMLLAKRFDADVRSCILSASGSLNDSAVIADHMALLRQRDIPVDLLTVPALGENTDPISGSQVSDPANPVGPGGDRNSEPELKPELKPELEKNEETTRTVAILFGDIAGFSKLRDDQVVPFIKRNFDIVANLLEKSACKPLSRNTWGDALYLIFDKIGEAGLFALDLKDALKTIDWTKLGMPGEMRLRVAMHIGPAHYMKDPVTDLPMYTGSHVTRTARIEPVTPPGQVYVTQAFAAMAVAQGVTEFQCDYVGMLPLAKRYGAMPAFHLRRTLD